MMVNRRRGISVVTYVIPCDFRVEIEFHDGNDSKRCKVKENGWCEFFWTLPDTESRTLFWGPKYLGNSKNRRK